MKKELSVVFPIYHQDGKYFLLMGKCAPGKKLSGIRNGFGGKCEPLYAGSSYLREETTLECARRELEEELRIHKDFNINIEERDFIKIGAVIMGHNIVDFFVINLNQKIEVKDNDEFVDNKWFELHLENQEPESFVSEMLSGDDEVIKNLKKYLHAVKEISEWKTFEINKSEDRLLQEQTKNVFK